MKNSFEGSSTEKGGEGFENSFKSEKHLGADISVRTRRVNGTYEMSIAVDGEIEGGVISLGGEFSSREDADRIAEQLHKRAYELVQTYGPDAALVQRQIEQEVAKY